MSEEEVLKADKDCMVLNYPLRAPIGPTADKLRILDTAILDKQIPAILMPIQVRTSVDNWMQVATSNREEIQCTTEVIVEAIEKLLALEKQTRQVALPTPHYLMKLCLMVVYCSSPMIYPPPSVFSSRL